MIETTQLNNLYSRDFVKSSRTLRRIKSYNGVKMTLEMALTYDLIASFNRDQKMTNGHIKKGQPSQVGQSELADYLMSSPKTASRTILAMKQAGLIECVGRGAYDVDLLIVLPISEELTEISIPAVKPATTRSQRGKLTKAVLPNAVPVEREDAGSINSASGHQNNTLESTAIIRNLDLDDNGPDIQLYDSDVELTEITGIAGITGREVKLTGANDDVCLTVVESGHSAGSEINMDVGRFDGEYLQVKGQLIRAYETEPKSNEWELDPAF
ncbi:hypothetical protein [Pantoea cypripedii]|uniref:Uncharacterized protein n=1 Tax=Pantoea cypripedii TaxID=55209 RepID=A0A6B9G9Z2_PANCY|nr:hypothetical protein [Pantoea cypripedii]QGY29365.1 hypothetical protein CUN67_10645 [Pantoea cypripedii]